MEEGALIEVWFFGEQIVNGTIQAIDKASATVAFGLALGGDWAVRVPRDWLKNREGSWLLEIG
ncbi:MAG: hypothetical protein WCD67_08230 [Xanthobacteraceae bacterium]